MHDHKDNVAHFIALAASQQPALKLSGQISKLQAKKKESNHQQSNKKPHKKIFEEKLPNINNTEQSPRNNQVPLYTISSFIPEFIDAIEATDSGERGFSAFTKSQNMDNDTQTNFNIIDYEDFK